MTSPAPIPWRTRMACWLPSTNHMARRNREWNLAIAGGQLAALAVLLAMLTPQLQDKIQAIGQIAGVLLVIAVAGLLCGLVVTASLKRSHHQHCGDPDASLQLAASPSASDAPVDLRDCIRALDWYQFERLVALIYQKQGHAVTRRGGAKPDGGIDLILECNGKRTAVQCKHWQAWKVGVKTVREFLGALTAERIPAGILVTMRGYTADARQLAAQHGIELVDDAGLLSLVKSTNLQTDQEFLRLLNDKLKYCPKCESEMVLRTSKYGSNAGSQFWGCSAFPKCRFTFAAE